MNIRALAYIIFSYYFKYLSLCAITIMSIILTINILMIVSSTITLEEITMAYIETKETLEAWNRIFAYIDEQKKALEQDKEHMFWSDLGR